MAHRPPGRPGDDDAARRPRARGQDGGGGAGSGVVPACPRRDRCCRRGPVGVGRESRGRRSRAGPAREGPRRRGHGGRPRRHGGGGFAAGGRSRRPPRRLARGAPGDRRRTTHAVRRRGRSGRPVAFGRGRPAREGCGRAGRGGGGRQEPRRRRPVGPCPHRREAGRRARPTDPAGGAGRHARVRGRRAGPGWGSVGRGPPRPRRCRWIRRIPRRGRRAHGGRLCRRPRGMDGGGSGAGRRLRRRHREPQARGVGGSGRPVGPRPRRAHLDGPPPADLPAARRPGTALAPGHRRA